MLKAAFLVLAGSGLPVAVAMLGAVLLHLLGSGEAPPFSVVQRLVERVEGLPVAVPFFVLTGQLMNNAGTLARIEALAAALVGAARGGLGQVNVVASAIFAGMSGTVIADAAGLGERQLVAMREHGYPAGFAVGLTAASATLGSILPPSLPLLVYGMSAGVSIPALFLAGIVPGVLIAALLMLGVARHARAHGRGADLPFSRRRFVRAAAELAAFVLSPLLLWAVVTALGLPPQRSVFIALGLLLVLDRIFRFVALLHLMTPLLLVGGMTTGLFTPAEGAIAASAWAMLLGFAWHRTLSCRRFLRLCLDTVEIVGALFLLVGAAAVFAWALEASGGGRAIADAILAVADRPWSFLLFANALLLLVGCVLDPIAAIALLVPILLPIVLRLGIDPVHFGLLMVLNLLLGLLHPPAGAVLAVVARIAGLGREEAVRAMRPWLLFLLASLAVLTLLPAISLGLPRLLP